MAVGIIEKGLIWLLGTSWKSSLSGLVIGVTILLSYFKPDLFNGGIDKIIEGIGFVVWGYTSRDQKVNDVTANVEH